MKNYIAPAITVIATENETILAASDNITLGGSSNMTNDVWSSKRTNDFNEEEED